MSKRKNLMLTVDEDLLKSFRQTYKGSISSFLDGLMLAYLLNHKIIFSEHFS